MRLVEIFDKKRLPFLFREIEEKGLTGTLVVKTEPNRATFFFENGKSIYSISRQNPSILAFALSKANLIKPRILGTLGKLNGSMRTSEFILNSGMMQEEVLRKFILDRIVSDLYNIVNAESGEIEMSSNDLPYKTGNHLFIDHFSIFYKLYLEMKVAFEVDKIDYPEDTPIRLDIKALSRSFYARQNDPTLLSFIEEISQEPMTIKFLRENYPIYYKIACLSIIMGFGSRKLLLRMSKIRKSIVSKIMARIKNV